LWMIYHIDHFMCWDLWLKFRRSSILF